MKEEAKFNEWLRAKLPGHFQRIESSTESGIPDINVAFNGVEIWIESKIVLPQGILLRPYQYAWGTRRSRHGNCFVVSLDVATQIIMPFKYPDFTVVPCGKYLKIDEAELRQFRKRDQIDDLISYLFGQS